MVKKIEGNKLAIGSTPNDEKAQSNAKEKIDPRTLKIMFHKSVNTRELTGLDVSNGQLTIEEGTFAGLDSLGGLKFFSTQSKDEYISPEDVKRAAAEGKEIRFNCE